jgi:hypothetical protein
MTWSESTASSASASTNWIRIGSILMCCHTFVGGLLGLTAIRRLHIVHTAAKQRSKNRAFHQTPTTEASLLNYELLWGILLSDMFMCLCSFPAFAAWAVQAGAPPDVLCYIQASTSVGLVGISVLFSALVAIERLVHVVNQRSMHPAVHYTLVVVATLWGASAGMGASLTSLSSPPISASGFFCAPNWSDPDKFVYSLGCMLTLVTSGVAICVGTGGVLAHLESHHLLLIWKQVAWIALVFALHWGGYIGMMVWQMFFGGGSATEKLRIMDAVVVGLGFNNGIVNSCVFLLWTSDREEKRESVIGSTAKSSRRLSMIRVQPLALETCASLDPAAPPLANVEIGILAFAQEQSRDKDMGKSQSISQSQSQSQSQTQTQTQTQTQSPTAHSDPSRPTPSPNATGRRSAIWYNTGIDETTASPSPLPPLLANSSATVSESRSQLLVNPFSPRTLTVPPSEPKRSLAVVPPINSLQTIQILTPHSRTNTHTNTHTHRTSVAPTSASASASASAFTARSELETPTPTSTSSYLAALTERQRSLRKVHHRGLSMLPVPAPVSMTLSLDKEKQAHALSSLAAPTPTSTSASTSSPHSPALIITPSSQSGSTTLTPSSLSTTIGPV